MMPTDDQDARQLNFSLLHRPRPEAHASLNLLMSHLLHVLRHAGAGVDDPDLRQRHYVRLIKTSICDMMGAHPGPAFEAHFQAKFSATSRTHLPAWGQHVGVLQCGFMRHNWF